MKKLISIVVPVYNEEENVEEFFETLAAALAKEQDLYDFEMIFTDNHSTDTTYSKLKSLASQDRRIRVFRFSRNFGYQKSILTGYFRARGDAAVQIDCDLQDPPSLISDFLREWERGSRVVYGVRRSRDEPTVVHACRKAFYRLLSCLSSYPIPHDAGDFRLIDRRIIEELRRIQDTNPYVRGRIALMGFQQRGIPYDRASRKRGVTKFSFGRLVGLAVDGIISHSVVPLRLATALGFLAISGAFLGAIVLVIGKLLFGQAWPTGFATIALLILFGIGVQGLMLGIMGEYVARIYEQLKTSPNAIIEEQFPADGELTNP